MTVMKTMTASHENHDVSGRFESLPVMKTMTSLSTSLSVPEYTQGAAMVGTGIETAAERMGRLGSRATGRLSDALGALHEFAMQKFQILKFGPLNADENFDAILELGWL